MTFKLQRKFVEIFLIKYVLAYVLSDHLNRLLLWNRSPRVTGLSRDAIFSIPMPFDLPTCAYLVLYGLCLLTPVGTTI